MITIRVTTLRVNKMNNDFSWVAAFNQGNCTDINSTRYFRYFNSYFDACIWLSEHAQHWNTGHRVVEV